MRDSTLHELLFLYSDMFYLFLQILGKGADQNLARCFQEIYMNEGIRGLWRVIIF